MATNRVRTPLQRAIDAVPELVGEPAWWADLRDRLIMAGRHDCPLARLVELGPPCRGESPTGEPGTVGEPRCVLLLRNEWERALSESDMPPGAPWPGLRPTDKLELQVWKDRLYNSFRR